jgi:hypothetical protein
MKKRLASVSVAAGFLLAVVTACGDGPTDPGADLTSVQISVEASGLDFPLAYSVHVNQSGQQPVRVLLGTTSIVNLAGGSHILTLNDVPSNCSIEGENPRSVAVASGSMTSVVFSVHCVAVTGVIQVTVASTGLDIPNYAVQVDDRSPMFLLGVAFLGGLEAGDHEVTLVGLTGNCTVADPLSRTLTVTTGGTARDTVRTTFEVTCVAVTGVIEVTVATSGDDQDGNGYSLRVDDGTPRLISVDAITILTVVPGGDHTVRLDEVASNCIVAESDAQSVSIAVGGLVRDTARTTFDVTCARAEKIAFTRLVDGEPWITTALADGSTEVQLALGYLGSWSPDGTKLVYTAVDCDSYWYYYYYGCFQRGLFSITADGKQITQLTNGASDEFAAWAPDGQSIAYARGSEIFVLGGIAPVPIVSPGAAPDLQRASQPNWSPDGARIAFVCEWGNTAWTDICVVNADGTGLVRLTNDPWDDASPAWSPDGTRIAFATNRDASAGDYGVAVMGTDGGNFTRIVAGSEPAWSREGDRIIFVRYNSDAGLYTVAPDGTAIVRVTHDNDSAPAWRP